MEKDWLTQLTAIEPERMLACIDFSKNIIILNMIKKEVQIELAL